jgi:hypothetical protein
MKQQALQILKGIHGIVKDDRTISRLLPQLGEIGLPYAQQAGDVARALGYGRKKRATRAPAKRRAVRATRGRGVAAAPNAQMYSATGKLDDRAFGEAVRQVIAAAGPARAAAPASGKPSGRPSGPGSRGPYKKGDDQSGSGKKRMTKRGKGFGDFLKGLIQAPLAGVAALSGGLHGAVGGFGRKPRARRAKKPTHIMLRI